MTKLKSYPYTKIFIEDNKRFADIALLVDNLEYIKEVNKIRNKLAIERLFKGSLRDLERFPYTKDGTARFPQSISYKRLKNWGEDVFLLKQEKYNNKQMMFGLLTMKAKYLLVKFGCPYLMLRAVIASIVCDRVLDEDSVPARLDFIDQFRFDGAFKDIPALAIEITPFTTKAEVQAEFEKKQMFYKDYLALYRHLRETLSKDAISGIKKDRVWYWKKVKKPKGFYLNEAIKRECVTLEKYLESERIYKNSTGADEKAYRDAYRIHRNILTAIAYIKKRVSKYKKLINSQNYLEPQLSY